LNYNKAKRILLLSVITWLIVRVVILFLIHHVNLFEVHDIAVNMVQTGEMKYFFNGQFNYNYQFPVYPSLLFILYKCFGIIPKLGLGLNFLLHSLAVLMSLPFFYLVALTIKIEGVHKNSAIIALLASLAILFHPLINYYALLNIHPFICDLFFLMLTLFCITRYQKGPTNKNLLLLAIAFGFTILDRPTLVICILPFFLSLNASFSFINRLLKTLIVLAIGFTILSPWLYRNHTIYHKFTVTSSTGQNLWLGIQQKTGGTTALTNGSNYYSLIQPEEWQSISKLNSEEQSDYFKDKYKQTIDDNPGLLVKMYLVKLQNFWLFRDNMGSEYSQQVKSLIPIYKWIYSFVLLLSFIFILLAKREARLIFSIPLSLSLLQAVFYIETRHRLIIEPILIFMAISTIYIIASTLSNKKNA